MRTTAVVLLCTLVVGLDSQNIGECPLGWFFHGQSCYEFIKDPLALYEEADKICKGKGAALVSVNSYDEHIFIIQQLKAIDIAKRYTWWTSGSEIDDRVKWEGDGQFADPNIEYWLNPAETDNPSIHVVYKYSYLQAGYGWQKQARNVKSSYICEIPRAEVHRLVQDERDFTFGTNIVDPNKVQTGPSFIIQPTDVVITERTTTASLECVARGNPQPDYRWYKGSNQTDEVVATKTITVTNGKLTFDNVSETTTAGAYQCVASNKFGSSLSDIVYVTYGYLREYSNVPPGAVNASQYQGTYINCNPPSHKPGATFQWMRDGKKGLEFLMPQLNNYYFVSQGGNLYFSEVQAVDTGYYYCSVTLSAGQTGTLTTDQPTSSLSLGIKLSVGSQSAAEYPPEIHDGFPIVYPTNPVRGMTIYIECLAYGRLPLYYSWTRKNKPMPSRARATDLNRVLVIENVQLEDEGTYECLVKSSRATSSVKEYTLSIGAKPYYVSPLKNIHADINSELTWRCEAVAIPRATFTWYKNTKPLLPVPGQIDITSNVLKITSLDPARDSGMYQCSAENSHGITLSGAQLRVLSVKPSFFRNPLPMTMYGAMNGNITIPCRPEAAPTPEISWLRDGVPIGARTGLHVMYNGDLRMTRMQLSDEGLYTCEATNVNGKAQSHCKLTVINQMSFIQTPVTTDVDYNNTAFLQCEVSYDTRYDLIYRWTHNGRVINITQNAHYRIGERINIRGLYIMYADFHHTGYYECQALTTRSMIKSGATLTVKGPPGEPAGIYADLYSRTPHSLRLKWTPPPDHGSPILYYIIESKTQYNPEWKVQVANISEQDALLSDPGSGMDKRTFMVTGLKPFNDYFFRVRAKNSYPTLGPISIPSDSYHLDGAAPVVAPRKVTGGGGTVGVLTITWSPLPLEDRGGNSIGYIIYWRLQGDTTAYKQVMKTGDVSQHVEDVGLNNYYLQYEVIIGAFNEFGYGPNSTIAIVYSAEGMPTFVPKNIRGDGVNSTSIYLTWDPVPNTRQAMKGVIQGFELNVEDFNDPNRKSGTTYLYGVHTTGTIIGVEPNSDYWVTVQVFNTAGESNPSERYRISTYLNAPFLYPEYVTISSHGSESVAVKWRGISTGLLEESIKGYKLEYWPRGENFRAAKTVITNKVTNAVIYGIQKDVIYSLRVLGYSNGGDGKKSPTQYFTLGGHVPVDPTISFMIQVGGGTQITQSLVIVLIISTLATYIPIL
ncbi:contactin-like isoform X2 [Mizuhopecten yessoensis]|uniref:Contactin n=2 Tax=Mizuhopecten yessoensis TaxID=6573 RepID=A0A210QIS8_MIZYE|nr:contactin-like isoform X2 [Mizuhopecten yessoensis]XP_021357063.1 contactin-like isoform X2 [Mizuhopecten yessoensis]OWF48663.1 Contactin [Mizuhopecten yessoensis]